MHTWKVLFHFIGFCFNFTKQTEVDETKTTTGRKFESQASNSAELKLQSSRIQEMSTKWWRYDLGQKVWKVFKFESSRSVIIVHLHKYYRKLWLPCDTDVVLKLFSARTISPFSCCECLSVSSCMSVADCWQVSESWTETILVLDSSSESPRLPWWLLWLVKNWANLGSVQNTQFLEEFFATIELLAFAGVDSLVLKNWQR